MAKQLPGYPLLILILGKDPISDAPVQRNATNVIRGLLSLVPNGDNIFNNLQQSGSLQKAFGWFNGEVTKLNLTWNPHSADIQAEVKEDRFGNKKLPNDCRAIVWEFLVYNRFLL